MKSANAGGARRQRRLHLHDPRGHPDTHADTGPHADAVADGHPGADADPRPHADAGPGASVRAPVTRTVSAPPSSGGDDFALLNNFLATVPDGSVIQFPNSVYRLSQGVMLGNRNNLVFKLGTAEFRLTGDGSSHLSSAFIPGFSYQSRWFTSGGWHLAFEGGKVVGNDSCPGCPQPLRGENQQAVRANNATFVEISGMTVDKVSGDGAFFDGGWDIWVHDTHVINAGRNGFTLIKGQRVLVERNTYDRVGYCTLDLEPTYASEASSDMTFRDNTAGSWSLDWVSVDGGARGADIRRVTVLGNATRAPRSTSTSTTRAAPTAPSAR